jgi:hypothetical protein
MSALLQTELFRRCQVCGAPLAKLAGRGRWQHVCSAECARARARRRYHVRQIRLPDQVEPPYGIGPGPALMVCLVLGLVGWLVLTAAALWTALH